MDHTNIIYFEKGKGDIKTIDAVRQVIRKLTFETIYCDNLGIIISKKDPPRITFIYKLKIIGIQVEFHLLYQFNTLQHYNHCLDKFNSLSGIAGSIDQLITHQNQRETLLFLEYKDCIQSIKCIQP